MSNSPMLFEPAPPPASDPPAGQVPSPESDLTALESELVARVREGDSAALGVIFTAYYEPLLRFAYGYVRTRALAEEVVQEVFLELWANREQWVIRDTVRQYLYVAVRNRSLNRVRRNALEQRWAASVENDESGPAVLPRQRPADEEARLAELDRAIQVAVDRLPPRCREAFLLSREHHFTYEQIAATMGTSVKTVQEQIGRALRALRASLAEWLT